MNNTIINNNNKRICNIVIVCYFNEPHMKKNTRTQNFFIPNVKLTD